MTDAPYLVFVGGFLGAGKTSLILAAARELAQRGLRSAIILNDQSDTLVDTELAGLRGMESGEVTGGCFCCRLLELVHEAEKLLAYSPDVVFAEPVGSCTDLSATILHPLVNSGRADFRIAPLTVLVDPVRATDLLRDDAEPSMGFLFRKQLEEADLVCFTKSDLGVVCPDLGAISTRQLSAKRNIGVAAWLDEVLSGELSVGGHLLDIDYGEYARAEAALAWLNLEMRIECQTPLSPAVVLGPFVDSVAAALTDAGIAIVHLKAIDQCESGFIKVAITVNGQEPEVEGDLAASPARRHRLLLNLRAVGEPDQVRAIVEAQVARLHDVEPGLRLSCFSPSPPVPEQRVTSME